MRAALFLLLFLCAGCGWHDAGPSAQQGKIALNARDSQTAVPLAGEWEFYWNRLLTPADFRAAVPPRPDGYLELPGVWNNFKIAGHPAGADGIATLRLFVDTGPEPHILALRLSNLASTYRLWIDGRMADTGGMVGRDATSEITEITDHVVAFHSDGKPVELVLQISNHSSRYGGARRPILIGPLQVLEQEVLGDLRIALFFSGSLLMMGLYHFARYLFRRSDLSSMFFASYCLLWTAAILLTSDYEGWLFMLFPLRNGDIVYRSIWLLFYLSMPAVYGYLWSLFPQFFPRTLLKVVIGLAGLLCLGALFAPIYVLSHTIVLFYLIVASLLLYCLHRLYVATWNNKAGAIFIFAGFGFLGASAVNDILFNLKLMQTVELVPVGAFAFALFQAIYLSNKSAGDSAKIEKLSVELDKKNVALIREMAESEQLSREIVHVSEDERRRISQDLHDGICQQLTAARLRLSVLKKQMLSTDIDRTEVGALSTLLEGAVNQAYDLSLGLWPVDTGIAKLAASLEEMCRRSGRAGGFEVAFHSTLTACAHQSPEQTKQLYRIAQEALANVVKHAQADHVRVSIECSPQGGIRLTVEDDGVGRAATEASKSGAGLGMRIMTHRAVIIGGTLSIADRVGGGTIISCTVPCAGTKNDVDCRFGKEPSHA